MLKLRVVLALLCVVCAIVSQGAWAQSVSKVIPSTTPGTNLRMEIVAMEANNAVMAAIAGKRPGQWSPLVWNLFKSGKAQPASCVKVAVMWFTHMKTAGGVGTYLPEGNIYDVARLNSAKEAFSRTGDRVSLARRPVNDPGFPGQRFFQELTVPLYGGISAVFVPEAALLASDNPIMGTALPGYALRGLPEGNESGVRTSVAGIPESKNGIRWSTPRNEAFGTKNELHARLASKYKNNLVILVVPPCGAHIS